MGLHTAALFRHLGAQLTVVLHDPAGLDGPELDALWASDAQMVQRKASRILEDADGRLVGVEVAGHGAVDADVVVVTPRFRVRARNEEAARGQGELFPAYRHHAVFTDNPFETIQAEGHHRDHAVAGQVIADLNAGPLAHLPSGKFTANAAWLVLAAMAHNLLRSAGTRAGARYARARTATVRRDLITVPARTARRGRGDLVLHLPAGHHREQAWLNLWTDAAGPPAAAA